MKYAYTFVGLILIVTGCQHIAWADQPWGSRDLLVHCMDDLNERHCDGGDMSDVETRRCLTYVVSAYRSVEGTITEKQLWLKENGCEDATTHDLLKRRIPSGGGR